VLERIEVRGFINQAPAELLKKFNQIYYDLKTGFGDFRVAVLSPSPTDLSYAIPLVIPGDILAGRDYEKALFVELSGKLTDFSIFGKKDHSRFILASDVSPRGYDELYSITNPDINFKDIRSMFEQRFNFLFRDVSDCLIFYLFSSPGYEGRVGGNALALATSSERGLKTDLSTLEKLIADFSRTIPPNFLGQKIRRTLKYDKSYRVDLRFEPAGLIYKFNTALKPSSEFLAHRDPKQLINTEHNISTTPFVIDAGSRLGAIYQDVLSKTDIPIPFVPGEIDIAQSEREIYEYSSDIMHFIYLTHLKINKTQIPERLRIKSIDRVLSWVSKSWGELSELMRSGRLFGIGLVGGVGEHLTRVTSAIMRATGKGVEESLKLSEKLYFDLVDRFADVLDKPIKLLHAELEREAMETQHRIGSMTKTAIESTLLDLEAKYPDGWHYSEFETQMKLRTGQGKARVRKLFDELLTSRLVLEKSPGLFRRIWF
jgi:hypothetical protein